MHSCQNEYGLIWAYQNPSLANTMVRDDFIEYGGKASYNYRTVSGSFIITRKRHYRTIKMPENDLWEFEMEQAMDAIYREAEKFVKSQYDND